MLITQPTGYNQVADNPEKGKDAPISFEDPNTVIETDSSRKLNIRGTFVPNPELIKSGEIQPSDLETLRAKLDAMRVLGTTLVKVRGDVIADPRSFINPNAN